MLGNKSRRLAELERQIAARHEQAENKQLEAICAQFTEAGLEAMRASVQRCEQAGYVRTAEDEALERRWDEAVERTVPEVERMIYGWRAWALAWCEAVRKYG